METSDDASRESRRLIVIGIAANTALALAKILGGVFGRSQALIADGIESSLDILNSGLMWLAVKYAGRPPDRDHPYGHGKMEALAAVGGSMILILTGLVLAHRSVSEIISLRASSGIHDIPAPFTLIILGVTIVTKEILFRWFHRRGGALGSRALQADALHHRSDALTSLAALIGISAALFGGPAWAQADDWAALFSCGLIVFNGLNILRGAIGEILDEQDSSETMETLLHLARGVPGVTSVEKCRVRRSGVTRIADLHVRVAGERTVHEGHEIAHRVKDTLLASPLQLADITVHIEPEEGPPPTDRPETHAPAPLPRENP
jgi:cation diffusion facilitator family transporter